MPLSRSRATAVYEVFKFLHILGAIGNETVTAFWTVFADSGPTPYRTAGNWQ